jgi:hypothetical protein
MAQEKFDENLMRMIAAELHVLSSLNVAREMFGKGYFSLGAGERAIVDQAVMAMVGGNYQVITPQYLAAQTSQQPLGFGFPTSPPKPEKT